MTTIRRIDPLSAFKTGLVVYGVIALIFLGLFGLCQGAIFAAIFNVGDFGSTSSGFNDPDAARALNAISVAGLCFLVVVGTVTSAITGGITFAIIAFIYNVTRGLTGGLQVELSTSSPNPYGKRKFNSAGERAALDDIEWDV